jgi:hypothetical protein
VFWTLPAAVFLLGAVAVLVAAVRAAGAARDLRREMTRFGEVRVALARVRDDGAALRRALGDLHRR